MPYLLHVIRPLLIALLTALACLAAPTATLAQDTQAPPGLSAADEYLETVPGAGGNGTVGDGRRPNADDPKVAAATKSALPAATVKALAGAGASGQDAAALAGRTAPAAPRNGSSSTGSPGNGSPGNPSPRILPDASKSGGPLASVGRIVTGSGGDGMGVLFPLLLIAGALAVAGTALWRRRSTTA